MKDAARQVLAVMVISFAFALVLVSTACPEDDVVCFLRSPQ